MNPTTQNELPEESTGVEPVQTDPPSQPLDIKSSRNWKKIAIIATVAAVVLGAAGYFAWAKFYKNETPAADSLVQDHAQVIPKIHYQLENKVISFDTESKQTSTLTEVIPESANVLDVYEEDDTWRLYYSQYLEGEDKNSLYYLEKDKTAEKISTASADYPAANAEQRVAAYSTIGQLGASAPTHTYVYRDGKEEEVYASEFSTDHATGSDLKDQRYTTSEVSSDGKKILLHLHSCYQCDGPSIAAAFELDIVTKQAKLVYDGGKQGSVGYFGEATDKYLVKLGHNIAHLGPVEGNYQEDYLVVSSDGTVEELLAVDDPTWGYAFSDVKAEHLGIHVRNSDYTDTYETSFVGIFSRASKALSKLSISGMPEFANGGGSLGQQRGNCFGFVYSEYSQTFTTYDVSAVCEGDGQFSYVHIGSIEPDQDSSYRIKIID